MLTLKKYLALSLLASLAFITNASAGLYGFSTANPYTREEKILKIDVPPHRVTNYREAMRRNIEMLSNYADLQNKDFQIVIHEGSELLNKSLWEYHLTGYNEAREKGPDAKDPSFLYRLINQSDNHIDVIGNPAPYYLRNLTGIVINNLYCSERNIHPAVLNSSLKIISLDYCPQTADFEQAIVDSVSENVLEHAFRDKNQAFNNIDNQLLINENAKNIFKLADAKNILVLEDDSKYKDKYDLIKNLRDTNFDVIFISPMFHQKTPYSKEEIDSLKFKKNGTTRLVFAIMDISEANPAAYYWNKNWKIGKPEWLRRRSFINSETIITEYWNQEWEKIISRHFKSIIDSGYNGAFLTGLQNHRYFEQQLPLE